MYITLKFLHVISVFLFLMAHGVSAGVAFQVRKERGLERLRALLDFSSASYSLMYVGLLLLLITGIITAFVGHWWGRVWIWLSIVLLIFIAVSMYFMGSQYYSRVRKAIGAPYIEKNKPQPPLEPASPETIDALLENRRAVVLTIIGFGGIAIIAWLMMYKPF
jgi:uncharacterized membrane protein